jgi:hypothetical protein
VVPVEIDLVDRLGGADAAEFFRTIGGQHDHRDLREPRLDHRRVEVRRRRATRAQQQCGHALEGDAERHERGRPLVVHHMHAHLVAVGERQRHRRRP